MERQPFVCLLCSGRHGTIYIGVASNLLKPLHQHRIGVTGGFTSRYGAHRLVHFEQFEDMPTAIAREKQLKAWRRDWKIALIERDNPEREDLTIGFGFEPIR